VRRLNFFEPIKDILFQKYCLTRAEQTEDYRYVLVAYGATEKIFNEDLWNDDGFGDSDDFPDEPVNPRGLKKRDLLLVN
tara:strand:+ start:673 stop:909 length:237 start_codon:yes stop_codon:yes gene_type:complete